MKIEITVNDIKQFFYCQRIVFFNHVMPIERKSTYKMELGKLTEEEIRVFEKKRNLKKYNLENGEKFFSLWISSEKMGLSGKLDMIIVSPQGNFPVEFKYSSDRLHKNHIYQMAAYALLAEEKFKQKVEKGFIYFIPKKQVYVIQINNELKSQVISAIESIKIMIQAERMPEAATNRNKCQDCEFKNFCGDIF